LQPLSPPGAMGSMSTTGANQTPGTGQPGQPGQTTNSAMTPNPLESQLQPFDGTVMGGNIIGVGSKIKKPSLKVYLGGDTYQQWEFIWNPTGLAALPGQTPANPNVNPTSAPNSANPNGTAPASPDGQQPQQTPQMPTVNVPTPQPPAQ